MRLTRRAALAGLVGAVGLAGGLSVGKADTPGLTTETLVRYPMIQGAVDGRTKYETTLLTLALRAGGPPDRPLVPKSAFFEVAAERRAEMVRSSQVDVTWFAHRPSLEDTAIRVDVPIYRGILGRRIMLIRASDRDRFAHVRTPADLKDMRIGQGVGWADTEVLKANGVSVITAAGHDNLIAMLAAGRIDGYPRGINEVLIEHAAWQADPNRSVDLAVEPHLVFYYPLPAFFYVAPTRRDLAARLQRGLLALVANGRFEALWQAHFGATAADLSLERRHVLSMRNPRLPGGVSIPDERLWLGRVTR